LRERLKIHAGFDVGGWACVSFFPKDSGHSLPPLHQRQRKTWTLRYSRSHLRTGLPEGSQLEYRLRNIHCLPPVPGPGLVGVPGDRLTTVPAPVFVFGAAPEVVIVGLALAMPPHGAVVAPAVDGGSGWGGGGTKTLFGTLVLVLVAGAAVVPVAVPVPLAP